MWKSDGKTDTRSLFWKIFITFAASTATYSATTFVEQKETQALMLSAFVGGVTLVVQFLLDVEARQVSVDADLQAFERRQAELSHNLEMSVKVQLERFNEAVGLLARLDSGPLGRQSVIDILQHAADLNHSSLPALSHQLAQSELSTVSNFIKDLGRGREVAAEGDVWPWMNSLTMSVQKTIDATSYSARGEIEQGLFDDDSWMSELGQRYLDLQERAIQRGVGIRRIFLLETPQLANHPQLREICDQQSRLGIDVRLIDAEKANQVASGHIPLIIFDRAVLVELTPSRFPTARPGFIKTTLVLNPFQVHEKFEMFQRLWGGAKEY